MVINMVWIRVYQTALITNNYSVINYFSLYFDISASATDVEDSKKEWKKISDNEVFSVTVTIAHYISCLSHKTRTAHISKGCRSLRRTVQTMQAYIQYVNTVILKLINLLDVKCYAKKPKQTPWAVRSWQSWVKDAKMMRVPVLRVTTRLCVSRGSSHQK